MMASKRGQGKDRIILFGRYPVPGKTKTRLIQGLGPTGAAEFQRRLTEKTLETLRQVEPRNGIEIEICLEGGTKARAGRWLGKEFLYTHQVSGDLGERMRAAFWEAFRQGCRRVVLVGTDIPGLKSRHMQEALSALEDRDLVLGPSTDGGYWLMGLNRPVNLFRGIRWGTEEVLEQTLATARGLGLGFRQLDPLTDVDTEEDLRSLSRGQAVHRPYVSVIIPALNESAGIERTVRSALHTDAEVIVVDGGSTDDTSVRAVQAGARVEQGARGRALQQNLGAARAGGEILLFLHADTRLPRGYVGHVFETLMGPATTAGAFRFRTDGKGARMRLIEAITNIRARFFQLPYGDQALFVRRTVFDSMGGFPETAIAEDLFFVRRLSKGGRIRIAPAEAVTSGRRWNRIGVLRTTVINLMILSGCLLGISPDKLSCLYHKPNRKQRKTRIL